MTVEERIKEQFDFSGITRYHEFGIKGKSIVVWNRESDSGHGSSTRMILEKIAPEATVISASLTAITSGDTLKVFRTEYNGTTYEVEDFIQKYKIKIISSSIDGAQTCQEYIDKWKYLKEKYNLIMFNSAGNDGSKGTGSSLPYEISMQIGAIYNNLVITGYSSIGEEVDFVNFPYFLAGTSFSCPYTAGMAALILCHLGDMTSEQMYEYLKSISMDLGNTDKDIVYGWGVPIMREPKIIKMQIGSIVMTVNGKEKTLDQAPFIVKETGRTVLPIRAISEELGCKVDWDAETQTVTVTQ